MLQLLSAPAKETPAATHASADSFQGREVTKDNIKTDRILAHAPSFPTAHLSSSLKPGVVSLGERVNGGSPDIGSQRVCRLSSSSTPDIGIRVNLGV